MHLVLVFIVSVFLEVAIYYHFPLTDLLLRYLSSILKILSEGGAFLTRFFSGS